VREGVGSLDVHVEIADEEAVDIGVLINRL
jgi:hypothetical protein